MPAVHCMLLGIQMVYVENINRKTYLHVSVVKKYTGEVSARHFFA